ncbi:hypothetical protein A3410_19990 [Escherichia coli]|nr:hypothetical protein [Escherichia coli]EFO4700078.1 hypothetical protein [Escherichia coli]EFX8384296.1 hypothetical protein [Shigella dysenteriae]
MTQPHPTRPGTLSISYGCKQRPAKAGFFIPVATLPISAAKLPPSPIKKGLANCQPLVLSHALEAT